MRICFVCLGNICRSPAAEAALVHLADAEGVAVEVASAGTADYHIGERPHELTVAEAQRRGIPIDHRGRQFTAEDFVDYDLVVAMDSANERDLLDLAAEADAAAHGSADSARKVIRFGAFEEDADPQDSSTIRDVRDPWGHGPEVFEAMYDHLDRGLPGILRHVRQHTSPSAAGRSSAGQ